MSDPTVFLALDPTRTTLSVSGPDSEGFLQGLLTNDVARAGPDRAVYAALLTPQGKFLFDALALRPEPERFLLETSAAGAAAFAKRLGMYKLRAAVDIAPSPLASLVLWRPEGRAQSETIDRAPLESHLGAHVFDDPRDPALGVRALAEAPDPAALAASLGASVGALEAHQRLRIELGVPEAGAELRANETFPLEAGFERAQGVDFKKGCYVGQEVTARMRHKATLKKGLRRVRIEGPPPPPGSEIFAGEKAAGVMGAAVGDRGLAVLRLDRATGPLSAEGATLNVLEDDA